MAANGKKRTFDVATSAHLQSAFLTAAKYAAAFSLGLTLTSVLTLTLIFADAIAWLAGQFVYASGDALVAGVRGLFGWSKSVSFVIAISLVSAALRGAARTKSHYITYVLGSLLAGSTLQLGAELVIGLQYFTIAAILLVPVLALRVPTKVILR